MIKYFLLTKGTNKKKLRYGKLSLSKYNSKKKNIISVHDPADTYHASDTLCIHKNINIHTNLRYT